MKLDKGQIEKIKLVLSGEVLNRSTARETDREHRRVRPYGAFFFRYYLFCQKNT